MLPVEGGWSAVLQVPAVRTEEALVLDLLDKDDVLVHPGYFFDFPREAFLVVSLLVEPALFDQAIARVLARAGGARRDAPAERHRGAAVLAGVEPRLGHRRVRRPADVCARGCTEAGPVARADPADQRDAADRDVAVLGDDGDGARSDLHLSLPDVPDFAGLGGEQALDGAERAEIAAAAAVAAHRVRRRCAG